MIPLKELEQLAEAMDYALSLRSMGHFACGYQVLLDGRHRAQHLRDLRVAWGEELVYRWQQASDAYAERFLVPLPA